MIANNWRNNDYYRWGHVVPFWVWLDLEIGRIYYYSVIITIGDMEAYIDSKQLQKQQLL